MGGSISSSTSPVNSGCQHWIITDVADGPWRDPAGPLQPVLGNEKIKVTVHSDFVNALDIRHVVEKYKPDIVVSFGTWRNVLTKSICAKTSTHSPSPQQQHSIQGRQHKVFDYGADFLDMMVTGVHMQCPCSLACIAPLHYVWPVHAHSTRPSQRCAILPQEAEMDFYQGFKEFDAMQMLMYWPSDQSKVMPFETVHGGENGCMCATSLIDLIARHRTILVLSAGRCVLWSKVIQKLQNTSFADPISTCLEDSQTSWGLAHYRQWCSTWHDQVNKCDNCVSPDKCMRCLRKARRAADIPDRKWVARTKNAEIQTEKDSDNGCTDNAAPSRPNVSWTQWVFRRMCRLCSTI